MDKLKSRLAALPTMITGGETYLSYQAVTNTVAAFLFPDLWAEKISEAQYQQILETVCTESAKVAHSPYLIISAIDKDSIGK